MLQILLKLWLIGNRTSCHPIRSVIILVIKQIGLLLHGRPILSITRMITDRIGLHSVLLPLQIEFNRVDNPSLPEANQLAIYNHGQGFEPGTTVNKSS